MRKRRRSRGYRNFQRKGAKPNFVPVILILCLSVGCGYATAKYVVDPVVNYVPQLTAESSQEKQQTETAGDKAKETKKAADVVEDDVKVKDTGKVSGYALQFGCYSSKDAAEKAMSSMDVPGLQIMEQNSMYKIVGEVFDTKEKAKEELSKSSASDKAFVTTIYK